MSAADTGIVWNGEGTYASPLTGKVVDLNKLVETVKQGRWTTSDLSVLAEHALALAKERDRLRDDARGLTDAMLRPASWEWLRSRDRILAEIERWADESYEVVDMDWHEWAKLALAEARRRVEEDNG